ncbi:MAG: hypothetical protein M3Y22_10970 [Pseudomonadota bacterium]|nr:hypothetical protein [Pseudomonadota bacterium]
MLDSQEFYLGRWGEIILVGLLLADGWSIVTTCDYSGADGEHAPVMHQLEANTAVVLPDIDAAKSRIRASVEAKAKRQAIEWRKTGRRQHGFDRRQLTHYRRHEQVTGAPVVIGVVELDTGEVLCNTLRGLGEPRFSDPETGWDMANWDRTKFRVAWRLNPRRLQKFVFDDGVVRRPPAAIPFRKLPAMCAYLRPEQADLPLLIFDVVAQAGGLA